MWWSNILEVIADIACPAIAQDMIADPDRTTSQP
jgi:hypothetical protein